jgi:hypothetical protein
VSRFTRTRYAIRARRRAAASAWPDDSSKRTEHRDRTRAIHDHLESQATPLAVQNMPDVLPEEPN